MRERRKHLFAACGVASLIALSASLFAQQPSTAPIGLDALSDQRLITDLANRGLTSLLDRALDINQVPPQEREGLRNLVALKQLSDPQSHLGTAQRRAAVAK